MAGTFREELFCSFPDARRKKILNPGSHLVRLPDKGCFLECNAHPDRLDLDDTHLKLAKELGVKIAVSTDAHSVAGLDNMRFGIWQARRGWLEAGDVLNTRSWQQLKKILRRS